VDHPPEESLDVERVLADEEATHVLHDVRHRTAAIRLADARDARVGVDSHEVPLEVALHDAGLDVRDPDVPARPAVRGVVGVVPHT